MRLYGIALDDVEPRPLVPLRETLTIAATRG
jgi:hypothetical protein